MDSGIFARHAPYLDRYVQIGIASQRVISVSFPEEPDDEAEESHELLDRVAAYLEGVEDDFRDVEVGLTVGGEERAVLETVREVPYGEQVTVEQLVRMTAGLDADEREDRELARTALAANPVPLFVPDHRVRDGASGIPAEIEQKLRTLEGL